MSLDENLNRVLSRYDELQALMSAEEAPSANEIARLSKEFADLTPVVKAVNELRSARGEAFDLAVMVQAEEDAEFRELVEAELQALKDRVPVLERQVQLMLLPRDEADSKNAILEVRAGTGGDEAALFAADLFRMYQRYAETRGWRFELMNVNEIGIGGYKEVVASVSGKDVFLRLKFESGVHRVQRVPVTESGGRIHTSAATVAVMPEAEEVDVNVNENDLRIDVFRASGPGGQSVNTTDSAVRITHIPTGIVVSQQDEKSQHKNKAKAMRVLRARLYDAERAAKDAERAEARRFQVGSGDRSERIRTYNFPERRVTDHRINLTLHQLDKMLDGDLDEVVDGRPSTPTLRNDMNVASTAGTVSHAMDAAAARLAAAGIDTARLDARVLMAHVMERDQAWLIGYRDDQLPTDARARYKELVARRAGREPIAYLTGVREFWSLDLRVTPDTLIPRPDSETLVEAALEIASADKPRILDLGTGSGCLLLAILTERRDANGLGIDISEGAIRIAQLNARTIGLSSRARFRIGTWVAAAPMAEERGFDLIVSNPPYIPNGQIADMALDVRHFEPLGALNGGADGLGAYREIAANLHDLIVPGGHFIGEFGLGQGPAVEHILHAAGLQVIGFRNDVAGRKRCVIAHRND